MSRARVVITGVGVLNAAVRGASSALGAFLTSPPAALARSAPAPDPGLPRTPAPVPLSGLVDETAARRLSRVCQLTVAAARLALDDAALHPACGLGLVIGTEFGDFRSTIDFADGYLGRGPAGLSALLFPNTVMNTMAATTAITVGAKELSLTFNAPSVAGELAIARGAAAIAAGRLDAALAGGVDELDPFVATSLAALGVTEDGRGEGAAFLVLESGRAAAARGASILGEILGAAWRALPAPPHGVGRRSTSRAVAAALADAGVDAADLGWVYPSASGDAARDAWEGAIIDTALAPHRPPATSLHRLVAHHAGLGALRVAAAAWTARAGLLPLGGERPSASGGAPAPAYGLMRVTSRVGLVHGVARGGTHVALVVGPPPEATP